jgi:tRNA dimethylallyltransferase
LLTRPYKAIAVVGPTATGKTALSIMLAKALQSDILSCDSQLLYQGIDIGVAKPTAVEQDGVIHHGLDLLRPTESCSAGDYAQTFRPLLDRLIEAGQTPVIVGGSGFYLRALLCRNHLPETPVDSALRQELQSQEARMLYAQLLEKDPRRAEQLHPHDKSRVIRALEINLITGEPVKENPTVFDFSVRCLGLTYRNRQQHLDQIEARLALMMENGFLEEVARLYEVYGETPALKTAHGYPELLRVVKGECTVEQALTQIQINIRQYSKRQMTWFKTLPNVEWFYVDEQPLSSIQSFL